MKNNASLKKASLECQKLNLINQWNYAIRTKQSLMKGFRPKVQVNNKNQLKTITVY